MPVASPCLRDFRLGRLRLWMGVLTVAFVADLTDVPQFEGGPEPHNDELKQLDPLQLAALGQLLFDGSIDERDPGSYGPTYDALLGEMHDRMHSYSDEEWAFPVPERLTLALAEVQDDRVPELAETWGRTEEFELDQKGPERGREYLHELRANARVATESGKQLFLWMSL
jgi:hypothetical protein